MRLRIILFIVPILFLFVNPVYAKYAPASVANNKFGIHIVDVNDISDAATLVNSTNGDWGYVTLVIQEDDRNVDKWQRVFDQMRRLHLIPIVRLATHVVGTSWVIPSANSAEDWTRFLNSLNWPTENRYVILFNEPNHANEWGGILAPEEYADTVQLFTQTLHRTSEDFFVIPAGLDDSAASDGLSMDAAAYWSRMVAHSGTVFDDIDGWSSHSYPNPGFSGSVYATGRGTLYSYLWERNVLHTLGISKDLPVFITETGWVHAEGVVQNPGLLTTEQIGNNLKIASQTVWQDPLILAVTPFVLNYQGYPFDHFSWRMLNSNDYYSQYAAYQSITKTAGTPKQRETYEFVDRLIPTTLVAGSTYTLSARIKNTGEGILSGNDTYDIRLSSPETTFTTVFDPIPTVEPSDTGMITLHVAVADKPGTYPYSITVTHHDTHIIVESGYIHLVPPPSIVVRAQLGWRTLNTGNNVTVLIYDKDTLIHKTTGLVLKNGAVTIGNLRNVVPGYRYRVVTLVPFYLPRQTYIVLADQVTNTIMPRMYPLDFNQDGKFTASDILSALQLKPNFMVSLFVGP